MPRGAKIVVAPLNCTIGVVVIRSRSSERWKNLPGQSLSFSGPAATRGCVCVLVQVIGGCVGRWEEGTRPLWRRGEPGGGGGLRKCESFQKKRMRRPYVMRRPAMGMVTWLLIFDLVWWYSWVDGGHRVLALWHIFSRSRSRTPEQRSGHHLRRTKIKK